MIVSWLLSVHEHRKFSAVGRCGQEFDFGVCPTLLKPARQIVVFLQKAHVVLGDYSPHVFPTGVAQFYSVSIDELSVAVAIGEMLFNEETFCRCSWQHFHSMGGCTIGCYGCAYVCSVVLCQLAVCI